MQCPVCRLEYPNVSQLAAHFVMSAECSDSAHVMWLNRNLTKERSSVDRLTRMLMAYNNNEKVESNVVQR